jgi:hypothetical protein
MFDLAIDSKLRGCEIVKVKIGDLVSGGRVRSRAIVVQQKTSRPVRFELLEPSRGSILAWLERRGGTLDEFVFPIQLPGGYIATDRWMTRPARNAANCAGPSGLSHSQTLSETAEH